MTTKTEFKREDRYIVIKRDDVDQYLTTDQSTLLEEMLYKIESLRTKAGRRIDKFVCVADDWPEYETVWAMLQARVDGRDSQPTAQGDLWEKAVNNVGAYATLYHNGPGVIYEIRSEHQRLISSAQPAPIADSEPAMTNEQIKAIALRHGFVIKEGLTDLKQYVYDFARELLAKPVAMVEPVADALVTLLIHVNSVGVTSDVQTHDNSYADVLKGLTVAKEEILRIFKEQQKCPYHPSTKNDAHKKIIRGES